MVEQLSKDDFVFIVNNSKYKHQDVSEAVQYGNKSVADCYDKSNHEFAKYYTVSFDDMVMVTIMLQRDGNLVYFVTKDFTDGYKFKVIRAVKELAISTVSKVDVIFTTTASFYKEALQFNRVIGFELYKNLNRRSVWLFRSK